MHKDVYFNKGSCLIKMKNYEEAIESFNKVIEIDSKHKHAHFIKGLIYNIQNNYNEALICFNRAIDIEPGYMEAHNYKANTLKQLGFQEDPVYYDNNYISNSIYS